MFVGLDLSLTATGFSRFHPETGEFRRQTLKPPKGMMGPKRLVYIRDTLEGWVSGAAGAAVEGYSFGSKFNRENMGELGGVIRVMLFEKRIPYIIVPPTSLKKFITGKGNAGEKGLVMVEVFKRYGVEADDNNQADAVVLASMARCKFGAFAGEPALHQYQIEALSKCELVPVNLPEIRMRRRPAA